MRRCGAGLPGLRCIGMTTRTAARHFFLAYAWLVAAARVSQADPGQTLTAALATRDRAAFESAIVNGADGSATPVGPNFLLTVAAAFDAPMAIRTLVARGIRVDHIDSHGETALFAAAAAGADGAVAVLLELGADPGLAVHSGRAPQWTALFAASVSGHADVAGRLLAVPGARGLVNQVDRDGRTPLFHAALHGEVAVVALLLAADADSDAKDAGGETPRSIATKAGRRAVLNVMAQADARRRP